MILDDVILNVHLNHPEPLKIYCYPGPTPRASDLTDLGWGPGITIFTKLPGGSYVQVQRGEEALEGQEKGRRGC